MIDCQMININFIKNMYDEIRHLYCNCGFKNGYKPKK